MGNQDMADALQPADHQALANAIEASQYWAHATELVHALVEFARANQVRAVRLLACSFSDLQDPHLRSHTEAKVANATRMAVAGHGTLIQPFGYGAQTQPVVYREAAASLLEQDPLRALAISDTLEAVRFKFMIGDKGIPESARLAIDATQILAALDDLCRECGCKSAVEVQPSSYHAIEVHMASRVEELRGSRLRHQEVRRHNEILRNARAPRAALAGPDFVTRSQASEQLTATLGRDFARRAAVEQMAVFIAKGAHQQAIDARQAVHAQISLVQTAVSALKFELDLLGGGRGSSADRHSVGSAAMALAEALGSSLVIPELAVIENLEAIKGHLLKPGALDENWGLTREPIFTFAENVSSWLRRRSTQPAPFNWRATHSGARGAIFAAIADTHRPSPPSLQLVAPAALDAPSPRRRLKA